MSEVRVEIAGRPYQLTCAPGEEEHIVMLANSISIKVEKMKGLSEPRTLLFAALILADELHEAQKSGGSPQPASAPSVQSEPDLGKIAVPLENLAEKLEALANNLENQ